jgi:uncharacterized membrane protein YkoI
MSKGEVNCSAFADAPASERLTRSIENCYQFSSKITLEKKRKKIMKSGNKYGLNLAVYVLLLVGLFAFSAVSGSAQTTKQSKLAKQAKISKEKAREIAQAKEPNGKIEEEELEKENGKLVYSFDIRNEKGTITEVQVDAKTGEVVSVEEENKQQEEKEKREDAKKTKKKS